MLPFIDVFGFRLASYGTLIVLGTAAGVLIAVVRSPVLGVSRTDIFYACIYALIGTAAGAKLLYIATALPDIVHAFDTGKFGIKDIVALLTGGFVFYGGLIGAIAGIFVYAKKYQIDFWRITDTVTPSIPLIHAVGRLGCFCAGCCYGKEFPPPLGVLFDRSPYAPHGITLFPVQLFESLICIMIFVFLLVFARKKRRGGVISGTYILCYTAARFALEYFRMDEARGFLLNLSVSQWISVFLAGAAVLLIVRPFIGKSEKNKKMFR
ncbi:MAG: Prolipoprotein diacylglyceryl transferase [Firmicutes bacterium ADurb.Bin182]|nr:MAG: Prolipoprotein diacylglyceryl transferase [Firmicutes bacterium ADurb.Bin182]